MEKRTVTNLLLGVMICGMALGAGAGIALNWKNITETVNGWAGDNGTIALNQLVKNKNVSIPSNDVSGATLNITAGCTAAAKDGQLVFTNTNTVAKDVISNIYFESEAHDMTGYNVWYIAYKQMSAKAVGSRFNLAYGADTTYPGTLLNKNTVELNVWGSLSAAFTAAQFATYKCSSVNVVAGDVYSVKDFEVVNLSPMGIYDVTEAKAVYEKLRGETRFEGEKKFKKSEVKKAISDYEAEQAKAAAATSSAATSSAAA